MPRSAARSRNTHRISAAMRASGRARWRPAHPMPSRPARESSDRRRRAGRSRRASRSVQSDGSPSGRPAYATCAAFRWPTSKAALCATRTPSARKRRKRGSASASGGAPATMASVIPVRWLTNAGIGRPGLTSVTKLSTRRPLITRTAPISVIPDPVAPPPTGAPHPAHGAGPGDPGPGRAAPRGLGVEEDDGPGGGGAGEPIVAARPPAALLGIEAEALVGAEQRREKAEPELGIAPTGAEDQVEELLGRGSGGSVGEVLVDALAHAPEPLASEAEETPPLRRRARWLLAGGDRPQLGGEALELPALPLLELLELAPAAGMEVLEGPRPAGVEASERLLDPPDHAERRHEAAVAVRTREHDAGA